jgi:hypothetical protein
MAVRSRAGRCSIDLISDFWTDGEAGTTGAREYPQEEQAHG